MGKKEEMLARRVYGGGLRHPRPESDPITDWFAIPSASITLENHAGNYDNLYDLTAGQIHDIQALGGECANVSIVANGDDYSWRLLDRHSDENYAAYATTAGLLDTGATPRLLTPHGTTFQHAYGLHNSNVWSQMRDAKAWIEAACPGSEVKTFCWPFHSHDRASMRAAVALGFVGARNGYPSTRFPAAGLLGNDNFTIKVAQSWAYWVRYEMPSQYYLDANNFAGHTRAEMEEHLYDTTVHQTTPNASLLYGAYTNLMDQWKGEHCWVQVNMHAAFTQQNIEDLFGIFLDDGDFWVGNMTEISEYAAARHANFGAAYNDEFIWEPLAGYEATDPGDTPWNGYKAAITFSCDQAIDETYDNFLPAAQAVAGAKFTAFITPAFIDANPAQYMTTAELQAVWASGLVELGHEGWDHSGIAPTLVYNSLINEDAFRLTHPGDPIVGAMIDDSGVTTRVLSFWIGERSTPFPLTLPNVVRWWDGPNLGLANGATVTDWYERVASDTASNAGSTVTYATNYQNGLACVYFDGTYLAPGGDLERLTAGFGNVHSNTDGLMIFVAGKFTGSTRQMVSKAVTAGGAQRYFWRFGTNYANVAENKASSAPGTFDWNVNVPPRAWPFNTFGIVALCWTPGGTPTVYVNGVAAPTVGGAVNHIDDDDGDDAHIVIGALDVAAPAGENMNGWLGDIIIVNKHSVALRRNLFGYLGDRWNIAVT